jgi:hypothetical protein
MIKPLAALLLLLSAAAAFAQTSPASQPSPPANDLASRLEVSLITIGPGVEAYEKFGHNMIRLHDPSTGFDASYNWGMFSFDEPNFIGRFIQGRMEYWMAALDTAAELQRYQNDDRSIWIQYLNLTPDEKILLARKLEANRLPQNRNYRYDYYRDNCSTRVRDALNEAANGAIRRSTEGINTHTTFRWHTRRLSQDDAWLYVALDYILGHPVDVEIDRWQEGFLPVKLMEHLRTIQTTDATGAQVPLVAHEQQLYQSTKFFERSAPPQHAIWLFLLAGFALAAAFAILPRRPNRGPKIFFAILAIAWSLLGGTGGAISTWGFFFTDHVVSYYNENWLQLSPFMLPLIVFIPAMLLGKPWGTRWSVHFALLTAALSLLGFAIQILPNMNQPNGEIIALTLPANLGLVWGVWRYSNVGRDREGHESAKEDAKKKNVEPSRHPARGSRS